MTRTTSSWAASTATQTACRQIKDGFVDSTGVQDLYFEAETMHGPRCSRPSPTARPSPMPWLDDPGFALTAGNLAEREMDMWGCKLLADPSYNP